MKPIVLVAMVLLASAAARAECPAKTYYDQATAAYGLGRFAEAATAFEKAYECKPQAALLWDAAQSHREAGNRARAIELLRNYVHVYGGQAENGADVRKLIADLQAEENAANAKAAPAPTATPPATSTPATTTPATTTPATTTPAAPGNALVATAPPPKKPIYKRAWFWGAVAGGAVVLGVVIGVSVAYGTTTKDPTPSIGTWAY